MASEATLLKQPHRLSIAGQSVQLHVLLSQASDWWTPQLPAAFGPGLDPDMAVAAVVAAVVVVVIVAVAEFLAWWKGLRVVGVTY